MNDSVDFNIASSNQIEEAIDEKIRRLRLARNWTREKLAREAGVSMRTIANLEEGRGTTFNTIIRILKAFNLQANLSALFPDLSIHPIELLETGGKERKRASMKKKEPEEAAGSWKWNE
jgi:transcriptional regulator with XRE-family HTH domain